MGGAAGDGTDESRRRMQQALAHWWPYLAEMFDDDALERRLDGIAPPARQLRAAWEACRCWRKPRCSGPRPARTAPVASAASIANSSGMCWRKCSFCSAPIQAETGDGQARADGGAGLAGAGAGAGSGSAGGVAVRTGHRTPGAQGGRRSGGDADADLFRRPATEAIAASVRQALGRAGETRVVLRTQLSPPWTTDWISAAGRDKLRRYGIAPPEPGGAAVGGKDWRPCAFSRHRRRVPCGDRRSRRLSQFGATACKALYRCEACLEPFEYFKPI